MFGKSRRGGPPPAPSIHFRPVRPPVKIIRDTTGRPAVDLGRITLEKGQAISLTKKVDAVGVALANRGLSGIRVSPLVILDRSGSMAADFRPGGPVETILERALAFALQVSPTGSVPVVAFDGQVNAPVTVDLGNYRSVIGREIPRPGFGSTNMTDAMRVVRDYATRTDLPLFCVVVADGGPNEPDSTTREFCDLAAYPVFLKLLAVKPVPYFATLDDLDDTRRLLDNVDAKPEHGGESLLTMDDARFADAMVDEFDSWVDLAVTAGILAR